MEFQNTIAYGTFLNTGGQVTLTNATWTALAFVPTETLVKNVNVPNGATTFKIQVQETGMYWVESY